MKKLILLLTLGLTAPLLFAHDGERCNKGEKMAEKLQLNEQQSTAVSEIMQAQKDKRKAFFKQHHAEMKDKMAELHHETRSQLSNVLSEEQLATFDEMHKQRMEKREQRWEQRKNRFKDAANKGEAS